MIAIKSAEHFLELLSSNNKEDYNTVRWGEAPDTVWFDVLNHRPDLAYTVSLNKRLPKEIISMLARHKDVDVRSMIVGKSVTSKFPEILEILSIDECESIRASVAANPQTPSQILLTLIQDPRVPVALSAERNLINRGEMSEPPNDPSKILCPFCGQNYIKTFIVTTLDIQFFGCIDCEALWLSPPFGVDNFFRLGNSNTVQVLNDIAWSDIKTVSDSVII